MTTISRALEGIPLNPNIVSLKRLTWAYGCSPKGSDEERQLEQMLIAKIKELL